ncbi:MAG: hypothetical protein K2K81_07405 [Muribaculaceae bacterium]|nr:hypothetical protein [Muribaculaceae bacterium]
MSEVIDISELRIGKQYAKGSVSIGGVWIRIIGIIAGCLASGLVSLSNRRYMKGPSPVVLGFIWPEVKVSQDWLQAEIKLLMGTPTVFSKARFVFPKALTADGFCYLDVYVEKNTTNYILSEAEKQENVAVFPRIRVASKVMDDELSLEFDFTASA